MPKYLTDSEYLFYRQNTTKLNSIDYKVKEWISKQSHDKCWYYADIFKSICEVLEIPITNLELPPLSEFQEGCRKYQDEIYERKV